MKITKILVAAVAVIFAASELSAKSGVEVGYLNSMYSVKANGEKLAKDAQPDAKNGFYVGYNMDFNLVAGLSVQPAVYYSFGSSSATSTVLGLTATGSEIEHNLNIPVNFKYTFDIIPQLKVYVFAGPTLTVGLANGTHLSLNGTILGQTIDGKINTDYYTGKVSSPNLSEDVINTLNSNATASWNRCDVMIGGGVGFDLFDFLTVKGGYDYGLLNRYKTDANTSLHRSQFYVSVGFNF